MSKRVFVVLIMSVSSWASDRMANGGTPSTGSVHIELRDVRFDGQRLVLDVGLLGIRDTLIDTRLGETLVFWPNKITTCSGTRIPVVHPALPHSKPSRGEELLLKEGYKFERRVALEPLRTKLDPDTCVDIEMRLRGAADSKGNSPVVGTATLRTTVTSQAE